LWGRFREGLTPWRRRRAPRPGLPWPRSGSVWSESWRPLERWLGDVYAELRSRGLSVERGGVFDRWDMHVRAGPSGGARLRVTLEEHGAGRQLLRYRIHPRLSRGGTAIVAALCAFGAGALEQGAVTAGTVLLVLTGLLAARILHEAGAAIATVAGAVEGSVDRPVRVVPAELLERIPLRSKSAEALE
jgi:hypothetical protein